jgi:phage minor structural protein
MIPVLYISTETDYTKVGMPLTECVKCEITEERNGAFDGELSYPVDGVFFAHLTYGAIVKTTSNTTSDPQLFRIQKVTKVLGGIITYYMTHISYELSGFPLYPDTYTAVNPEEAITQAIDNLTYAPYSAIYSAWSDIATELTFSTIVPITMRAFLGGSEGSVLDRWGTGEYEFDNRVIKFHAARGADNGVTIEYGKNLIDLNQEENIEESYTRLVPYAVNDGNIIYIPGAAHSIYLADPIDPGYYKGLVKEFTFEDGETPSSALLLSKANAWIAANDPGKLKVSLTVQFVPLADTADFGDYPPIETVSLCDIVTINYPKLGVSAKAKVIKTVYDSLRERYISIDIGDAKTDIVDAIKSIK